MRPATALLATLLLTRCADDPLEPATFGELCGAPAPARVLELPAGHALWFSLRIGDHLYHRTARPVPDGNFSAYAQRTDEAHWFTGPCGEAPVQISIPVSEVFTLPPWPDVPLGCKYGAHGVHALDPDGVQPPHLVFDAPCRLVDAHNPHGLVSLDQRDDDDATLLFSPYPDDPYAQTIAPEVLLPAIRPHSVQVGSDAWVHAITTAGALVRVDLRDRSVTTIQTDVDAFTVSSDDRYLYWVATGGVISLRDETTGVTLSLGTGPENLQGTLSWTRRGFIVSGTLLAQRIYRLPDLQVIDLPPYFSVQQLGPSGDRWPIQSLLPGDWLRVLDLEDASSEPLFAALGTILGSDGDSVRVLAVPGFGGSAFTTEGPVWRVPLDGSTPRRVAARATVVQGPLDPHAMITAVDIGADRRGTLIRIDLDTGAEQIIADRVILVSDNLADLTDLTDPELITYTVDDGEHSVVWMARLAPAP